MTKFDLAVIEPAVERGDHRKALVHTVAGWRTHRSALLANLADALATKVLQMHAMIERDKASFQKRYIEVSSDSEIDAATTLADHLLTKVPIQPTDYLVQRRDVKRHTFFLERIEWLADRKPDPRLARALVEVLVRAPYSVEDCKGVYGPVIDLVVRHADERGIAALEALIEKPVARTKTVRDYFAKALPAALAKMRKVESRDVPAALRSTLEEVLATLSGPAPATTRPAEDLDALLAECLANPDDDAPRLVYADALLEANDPRGEFIQLQLRAEQVLPLEADATRAASIQRKHEKAWLGDIARVTKLRVFRRGFLDEAEVLQGAAAEPATWRTVAADPRMATVRTLHKGKQARICIGRSRFHRRSARCAASRCRRRICSLRSARPPSSIVCSIRSR